jgi:hypothetical protein
MLNRRGNDRSVVVVFHRRRGRGMGRDKKRRIVRSIKQNNKEIK